MWHMYSKQIRVLKFMKNLLCSLTQLYPSQRLTHWRHHFNHHCLCAVGLWDFASTPASATLELQRMPMAFLVPPLSSCIFQDLPLVLCPCKLGSQNKPLIFPLKFERHFSTAHFLGQGCEPSVLFLSYLLFPITFRHYHYCYHLSRMYHIQTEGKQWMVLLLLLLNINSILLLG